MRTYEYEFNVGDMPDYDGMEYEDLVSAAQFQWLRAEHAEKRLECADAMLDSAEDENAALRRELKMARGELSVMLNNWEQARGKIRREKDELARRRRKIEELEADPDSPLAAKVERLAAERDRFKAEAADLRAKLAAAKEALV